MVSTSEQSFADTQGVILCQIWVAAFLKRWNYKDWDKTDPFDKIQHIYHTYSVITYRTCCVIVRRNVEFFSQKKKQFFKLKVKSQCRPFARSPYVQNSLQPQGKGYSLSFLQLAFTVSLAELMHLIFEAQVSSEPLSGCWRDLTDCADPFQARCCWHNSLRNTISGKLLSTN